MDGRFTDEELAIAKSVDLCAVAEIRTTETETLKTTVREKVEVR